MKLLRIVFLHFSPAPNGWDSFRIEAGDLLLEALPIGSAPSEEAGKAILVRGAVQLAGLPTRNADGYIAVPDEPRRRLESLIEAAAALIAVTAHCKHSISSGWPAVAMIAENIMEQQFLDRSEGIADCQPTVYFAFKHQVEISPQILAGLDDRRDGLVSLGEAYGHDRALGRYREFMRFFEVAFGLPSSAFAKKVHQFLSTNGFGYTHSEVQSWCALRHGSVHGDLKKTPTLVVEADVRPLIGRMEQAALDVLLNKKTWHDSSRERRELWTPAGGTRSPEKMDLAVVRGRSASIGLQFVDQFHAYPLNLHGVLAQPPREWWYGRRKDDHVREMLTAAGKK